MATINQSAVRRVTYVLDIKLFKHIIFKTYIVQKSRTVAQWTKAVCFGSGSRDARWFESPFGKKFSHGFRPVYWTGAHPAS